ncbi:MAG TPA: site-2 protease family protein [Fimbriimonadaceae bacterium]|nr:site-2 protease family protein [Fimbriimonadaceae bacterium]
MQRRAQNTSSPWSLRVATVAGIPIRLHFTFLLFLVWIYIVTSQPQSRLSFWLVPGIFVCVLLHELGHALTAKRFGVETRDITLYPIGGVAMLQGRRPKPVEEFWIAIAGPAVNVVIALILLPFVLAQQGSLPPLTFVLGQLGLLEGLFVANIVLPLFNMIPAFPMDGGRILRSLLAMNMPQRKATQIAGAIGQFLAIAIGMVGLFLGSVILMLVAFFVFLGAGQEVSASIGISLVENRRIADAMLTQFRTIESAASLEMAAKMLLEGAQQDFPVVYGEEVLGLLSRSDIARGLAQEGPTAYVSGHMNREFKVLRPEEDLERALEMFSGGDTSPVLVMEGDRLLGMVTAENLSEFLMLEHARLSRQGA